MEKKLPEISVILPFFNAEKTLSTAVKSILNQTFPDFELLLVNNCSTDNSLKIALDFANIDSRIRILNEENPGVANAMNCGLNNARAKFIARMDADDISFPQRLEKQRLFLKINPEIDFVGSEVVCISHLKNNAGFQRFVNWTNSLHTPGEIELNRFVELPVINPTVFFRREVFEKHGVCNQGNFPEDYEMQLRYLSGGVKMAKINETLLEWHDFSTRLTRTDDRYSTEAFFKVKAGYFKRWSEENNRFHPDIWIWGAGRKTRQRAGLLEKEGLRIVGYIDIKKSGTSVKQTIHYSKIPGAGLFFIVPMVGNTGAREQIKDFLINKNYIEGKDFMLMR
jgi:glycosyltransferase involved in cell wall biosynthesis